MFPALRTMAVSPEKRPKLTPKLDSKPGFAADFWAFSHGFASSTSGDSAGDFLGNFWSRISTGKSLGSGTGRSRSWLRFSGSKASPAVASRLTSPSESLISYARVALQRDG